jgi:phosphatidylglycerol:prolipoprotein diacylglycerol transferase
VRVWQGFSSTGGFIGAVIGSVLFWRFIRPRDYFAHADTIMFAFPFAWVFGRLGCFAAHDHIGRSSDFFLAVNFPLPTGPRHDLGLYEALWTVVISAVFFALDRKPRKGGFYIALWAFLYAPARFVLDFLRNEDLANSDVRWVGLTPAQWGMILMFCRWGVLGLQAAGRARSRWIFVGACVRIGAHPPPRAGLEGIRDDGVDGGGARLRDGLRRVGVAGRGGARGLQPAEAGRGA